jgi:hypothetical protein
MSLTIGVVGVSFTSNRWVLHVRLRDVPGGLLGWRINVPAGIAFRGDRNAKPSRCGRRDAESGTHRASHGVRLAESNPESRLHDLGHIGRLEESPVRGNTTKNGLG